MATATNGAGSPAKKIKKVELGNGETPGEEDPETQKTLEEIDKCQNEIDALNEKASEEILGIERNYNRLKKPHFEKRNDIIKKIPNFWVTTFVNHPQLSPLIDDEEVDCLQYVTKIEVEDFEHIKFGFKINFYFEEGNPYIENEVLTKEFSMGTNGEHKSTSTQIRWKKDQNLCQKKKKDPKASNSRKRGYEEQKKFFDWFVDNEDPQGDDIADIIKDDIWPNPLQYYLVPDVDGEENGLEDEGDSEGDEGAEDEDIGDEEDVEGEDGDEGDDAEEDD